MPEIVATVDNGIKMVVNGSKIQVVHVWGTPYEMGYAWGSLLSQEID